MLHGAPAGSIQKLQRVQNTTARIVLQVPRQSPSQPPGTVTLAASSPTHRLQACHPDLQDPTYINSCIPQLPPQTSGIYTPPPFFNHTAATQTDYQNSLRQPRFPFNCLILSFLPSTKRKVVHKLLQLVLFCCSIHTKCARLLC